jgi:hypothetical protein
VNLLPELGVGVDLMHVSSLRERFAGPFKRLGAPVSALHFETNEFHRCLSILCKVDVSAMSQPEAAGSQKTVRLHCGYPGGANSIDNDVINHAKIAHVCVIDTHVRAGFDRGLDHFACLIHNVTRPVEDISPRNI